MPAHNRNPLNMIIVSLVGRFVAFLNLFFQLTFPIGNLFIYLLFINLFQFQSMASLVCVCVCGCFCWLEGFEANRNPGRLKKIIFFRLPPVPPVNGHFCYGYWLLDFSMYYFTN